MCKKSFARAGVMLAAGLVIAGCSRETDFYDPSLAENRFKENFKENVMDGVGIDAAQTWNTTESMSVEVTSAAPGIVRIYASNPIGSNAAALATRTVAEGTTKCAVAVPTDATMLYVTLTADNGLARMACAGIGGTGKENISVAFDGGTSSGAKRKAAVEGSSFNFSDAPSDGNFPTAIPGGASEIGDYYKKKSGDYYVATTTTYINAWEGNCNLYFGPGDYELHGQNYQPALYVRDGNIYLLPGAHVTIDAGSGFDPGSCNVYIAGDASFTYDLPGEFKVECNIYNRGTLTVSNLSPNTDCIIYNEGRLDVKTGKTVLNDAGRDISGKINLNNNRVQLVNAGSITAESFELQGSSHFLNDCDGKTVVGGLTFIGSTSASWVNNGEFETEDWTYTAGSPNIFNKCRLTVNNELSINLQTCDISKALNIDGNGSVVTKYLLMGGKDSGPAYINMGSKALLEVQETATMYVTNPGYGIYGPESGDYAVFKAKNVVTGAAGFENYIAYGGNLAIDAGSHFDAQSEGGRPYYNMGGNAGFVTAETKDSHDIEKSGCSPGYGNVKTEEETTMYYYYAFEDLGATDDFDFNDVVVRVSAPKDGKSDIELCAAGGTLKTKVKLGNEIICNEVHEAFGVDVSTMVNTTAITKDFVKIGTVTTDTPAELDISIIVTDDSNVSKEIHAAAQGDIPLMIRISGDSANGLWAWPVERTSIKDAYGSFTKWAANIDEAKDWYKDAKTGTTVVF